ncbi:MAG: response regulator [Calditrichaceae bacterium]|nr:response regulator [Calditrichaceae bacterium]MBN2707945.1 response regulator [Calditrichaceae bacterium]RQV95382.1 MAG: response regulator [Calditrichota bacterium]
MAKRLLIVDDEETLTFSLYQSFILSQQDYEVVTANSGEEALKKSRDLPFDLIITDIWMPGINGFDLIRQVKQEQPQTEFVVMTAYGSSDNRERAIKEGARSYIEKPFEMKEMKKLVMDILG